MTWQYMKDVRAVENEPNQAPDEHEEIVITGRMLQELADHPNTQVGTTGDDLDGESHWTVFEGLIVFGAVSYAQERRDLFVYDDDNPDTNAIAFGLSSKSPNLRFIANGPRGNSDYVYPPSSPGVITDLELEVEYVGNADVDFDYVTFQTPNARALLRDQFRSRVSRQMAATINKVGQVVTNSSLQSKQFTILGVRSQEEEGELCWYGQRYLNILTGGLMISEINNKPYDRYRHVAYPFDSSTSGSYPSSPLPLWVWNEGSTGRLDPLTPVPFLRHGAQQIGDHYTYGYKRGVAANQYFKDGGDTLVDGNDVKHEGDTITQAQYPLAIGAAPEITEEGMNHRRMSADNYTLGYHCDTVDPGSPHGEFAYFKSASPDKMQLWSNPAWLEAVDLDGDPINDAPPKTSGSCETSYLNIPVQLSGISRTPSMKLAAGLYAEFLAPGNEQFLFSGTPWLEQLWMGTDKRCWRLPIVGDSNRRATVVLNRGDHARPYTAEEFRVRLFIPTLLGSAGLMFFHGNQRPEIARDANYTDQRIGYANAFNMNGYAAAGDTTIDDDSLAVLMTTSAFGPDYPTYAGYEIAIKANPADTTEREINLRKDLNWTIRAEGFVEGGVRLRLPDGSDTPDTLWFSTMGYKSENGVHLNTADTLVHDTLTTLGGVDIVQRVHDDGTIDTAAHDVERVFLGQHSARLELLRYTRWVNSSFVRPTAGGGPNDSASVFDADYLQAPGPAEVSVDTTSTAIFSLQETAFESPGTIADLLGRLDLQAWHSRGYLENNSWRNKATETNPLADWVNLSKIKTRHPYRVVNARGDYEHVDSMFMDLTLLYRRQDSATPRYGQAADTYMQEAYLGVVNRRDNALYMQDVDPNVDFDDQPRFSSTREFFALAANPSSGHRLYDQLGSRAILIPFDHPKTTSFARKVETGPGSGQYATQTYSVPVLLHITEVAVGTGTDERDDILYSYTSAQDTNTLQRRMIDTIIDPKGALEVSMLPGEGKLLRVRPIPAVSTADITGNLAFSTQTKIIAAPEQVNVEGTWEQTEKVRYHMAYTKQVSIVCDTTQTPPDTVTRLRVAYRRSIPYERDNVPAVAGLLWEPQEYLLGGAFDVNNAPANQPGTLWQAQGTPFQGYPPDTTTVDECSTAVDIDAAFPSIAMARGIRVNTDGSRSTQQWIHVVYSALVRRHDDIDTTEQHIVETSFIDGISDPGQSPSYSLSVIYRQAGIDSTNDRLKFWGTPTNGVSAATTVPPLTPPAERSDRLFTAWSVDNAQPITAGMRTAFIDNTPGLTLQHWQRDTNSNGVPQDVEYIELTQASVSTDPALRRAQYPSLTPTATAVGTKTPAASLVWQEQAVKDPSLTNSFDGWAIMYCRLWDDRAANVNDYLDFGFPDTSPIQYTFSSPPQMDVFDAGGGTTAGGFFDHYVLRVSDTNAHTVGIYPTITRSGLNEDGLPLNPASMTVIDSIVSGDTVESLYPYHVEALTFQTTASGAPYAKVHRRYFIHEDIGQAPAGPGTRLRYWYLGSTYASGTNVVSPTITQGDFRQADQTYFAPAGNGFDVEFFGNVSDTAALTSFGVVGGSLLQPNPALEPSGTLDWTAWNAPRSVWQAHLKYVPIPLHAGGFTPYGDGYQNTDRQSASEGIWPHLSHQMFGLEQAKQYTRRVQHTSGAEVNASILVSAEGFYKQGDGPQWRTKGGYHDGQDRISIGGIVVNGQELTFRRLHRRGTDLFSMAESIFAPLPDLVSQPFTVSSLKDIDLDIDGMMRDGVGLYLEQIRVDGSVVPNRSVNVGLPERPARDAASKRKISRFSLQGGQGDLYRFRLKPQGTFVVLQEEVLEDLTSAFARASAVDAERTVINLETMAVNLSTQTLQISVSPNPATDRVTLSVFSLPSGAKDLMAEFYSAVGERLLMVDLADSREQTINVSSLPSGTYLVRLLGPEGIQAHATCMITR